MTKAEIELVCSIIDKYTEEKEVSYCGPTAKTITNVEKLKNDIRNTMKTLE